MKVIVIDYIDDIIAKGTVYPDNKQYDLYLTSDYVDLKTDDKWKAFDDPEDFLIQWIWENPNLVNIPDHPSVIRYYIHEEYSKLSDDIKNNGVLLREELLRIAKKYLKD